MNTKLNDGGPAFPIPGKTYSYAEGSFQDPEHGGMSLRDYFAAKAMQAMLSNSRASQEQIGDATEIASSAFYYAGAMLAAREVQP